ncbi:hypothetical protein NPIL_345191 [Nephila pilipes]|uniref:Uncharacterized protein n=1 Tax=Nephila pilipes TaxID=299642 RepID=A0A8X6NFX8_NEPPI|nr:hypothetical protein NPIL_345191 [Nephila pilipes]
MNKSRRFCLRATRDTHEAIQYLSLLPLTQMISRNDPSSPKELLMSPTIRSISYHFSVNTKNGTPLVFLPKNPSPLVFRRRQRAVESLKRFLHLLGFTTSI